MRPPVSPLSTTTTRRTSCTLATRIPPNYEPGSRFRVLAPDGSEVDVTVPAGADLWWIVWLIFFLSFFVFAMFLRIAIRRKYGIREECCTCTGIDGFEDACCACWCGCCATAQMARHEYLEVETGIVRYDCCSATGE